MIVDYKKLKENCNVDYTINKKSFKVGNLTDSQLELAKKILSTKKHPTNQTLQQLKAVNYIINYRTYKATLYLENIITTKRINLATKKADIITNWINKAYK